MGLFGDDANFYHGWVDRALHLNAGADVFRHNGETLCDVIVED